MRKRMLVEGELHADDSYLDPVPSSSSKSRISFNEH